jgi:hypothetical protein
MRNIIDLSAPYWYHVLLCVGGDIRAPYSHSVCNKTQAIYCLFLQTGWTGGGWGWGGEMHWIRSVFQSSLKPVSLFRVLVAWSTWCRLAATSSRSVPLLRTERAI